MSGQAMGSLLAQRPASFTVDRSLAARPQGWHVLLVDRDAADAEALAVRLRQLGHKVECVHTGHEALAAHWSVELVLLHLELSDRDGLEVCRDIRAACDTPLIALAKRGTELDCVLGLQAGADDYLREPYDFRQLIARIDGLMRRAHVQHAVAEVAAQKITHGLLEIDPRLREVRVAGRIIDVTRKEFDLLYLLACHPGTVLTRSRLTEAVWGESWSRRTIDTHVSSLRAKLGASGWIITVRGVGFRMGEG